MTTRYEPRGIMQPLHFNEKWIRRHLPRDLPKDIVDREFTYSDFYLDGLTVVSADHGYWRVYEATNKRDLLLWQFGTVCRSIATNLELHYLREKNASKWRYSRDSVKDGKWLYIERKTYTYNAIEDTRLAWFETYLRLLKPVFPARRWKENVEYHIDCMNRWFKEPHWDYDRKHLRFVEISDSEEYSSDGTKKVSPDRIIKVID